MNSEIRPQNSTYYYDGQGLAVGTVALFVLVLCGYVALYTAAFSGVISLPLASIPATLLAYLSFTVMHDAGHGSIAQGDPRYLRFERLLGWISSLPFLIVPFGFFARLHDNHHAFTNHPDKDPDQWVNASNFWKAVPQALTLLPHYGVQGLVLLRNDHNMRASWPSAFAYWISSIMLVASMLATGLIAELLWLLIVPIIAGSLILAMLFDWIPHRPNVHQGRYQNTRIYLMGRLDWLTMGQNYHLIHHLFPKVPWYRYKQVFSHVRSELEQNHATIDKFVGLGQLFQPAYSKPNIPIAGVSLTLPLAARRALTEDVEEFRFSLTGVTGFTFQAGQYITLSSQIGYETVTRCYSIVSQATDPELVIAVKRNDHGVLSRALHSHAEVGRRYTISGAFGDFTLPRQSVDLMMVAAGSGIAPVLGLIKAALARSECRISLLVTSRNQANTVYYHELRQLELANKQRFSVRYVWTESQHRIDSKDLQLALQGLNNDCHCYVCGPQSLQQLCLQTWQECGVAVERYHSEQFKLDQAVAKGQRFQVSITLANGIKHQLTVAQNQTVLAVAREEGINLPSACGAGHCGSCLVQKTEGEDHLLSKACAGILPNERAQGKTLLCQCQPRSDICLTEL